MHAWACSSFDNIRPTVTGPGAILGYSFHQSLGPVLGPDACSLFHP